MGLCSRGAQGHEAGFGLEGLDILRSEQWVMPDHYGQGSGRSPRPCRAGADAARKDPEGGGTWHRTLRRC